MTQAEINIYIAGLKEQVYKNSLRMDKNGLTKPELTSYINSQLKDIDNLHDNFLSRSM